VQKLRSESGQSSLAAIALGIVAIFAVVILSIGAWKLDCFVKEKNTDRQVQIDNRQQGTQTAWHDKVLADIRDFRLLDDNDPRRGAISDEACSYIPRLLPAYRDPSIEAFNSEECS